MADKVVKSQAQNDVEAILDIVKKQNPSMSADVGTNNTVQVLGVAAPADWRSQASGIQPGQALPPWLWQVIITALQAFLQSFTNPNPAPQNPNPAPNSNPTPPAPMPK